MQKIMFLLVSFTLLFVSILISYGNLFWGVPLISLLNRWARWFFGSFFVASVIFYFGWLDRSLGVIWILMVFGWFLLETFYSWILIGTLNQKRVKIFPSYCLSKKDEWPLSKKCIELKEKLDKIGFKKKVFTRAYMSDDFYLRCVFCHSKDSVTRLQILLIPLPMKGFRPTYCATTLLENGESIITENNTLGFWGIFPKEWKIKRYPLINSVESLIKEHEKSIREQKIPIKKLKEEIEIEEVNEMQRKLEVLNVEEGIFHPRNKMAEQGQLTKQGRYKVWKSLWLANYLNISKNFQK